MARTFDGSDDVLVCSAGGLSAIDGGPVTLAFIVKLNDTVNGSVINLRTSTGTEVCQINTDGGAYFFSTSAGFQNMGTASTADNWHLFAVTKANASSTPRAHKYVYDTNTWSHTNAGGNTNDGSAVGASGTVQFGRLLGTSEYWNGELAAAGVWDRVLTDTEVEQLAHSLIDWHATTPKGLWVFDQADTGQKLLDLTGGGANESSITGTAVSTVSLPTFTYGADVLAPRSIPSSGQSATANPALETDTAQVLARTKTKTAGVNTETDSARALTAGKSKSLGRVTEVGAARTITPLHSFAENLLPNSSFELDANADGLADGLSEFGNPTTSLVTSPVSGGGKAQRLTVAAATNEDVRYAPVAITALQAYALSVYAKVNALEAGANFVLKVEWLNSVGALVNYDYTTVGAVDGSAVRRSFTSTPGAGAVTGRVVFAIEGGGQVDLDQAQLEPGSSVTTWNETEADWIMRAVMTEADAVGAGGAIGLYVDRVAIRPYEASWAALGLAAAYRKWSIPSYADALWNWVDWYAAHMETDGTVYDYDITGGTLTELTTRDSTDSYAGMFLLAVRAADLVDPRSARLSALQDEINKAVDAIELTQQADGLTWAKPEFHVKYLMDQAETLSGLRAAVELLGELGDTVNATRARTDATEMKAGIQSLWNAGTPVAAAYDWAKHDDNSLTSTTWATFGDALQQAAVVAFRVLPTSRHAGLMTQFDLSHPNADWTSYNANVGLGFETVGSTTRAQEYAANVRSRALSLDRAWDYNPMKAGWVTLTALSAEDLLQTDVDTTTVAIGLASGTDTAQPLTRIKVKALGTVTETDAPLSLTRMKLRTLGVNTEADTSMPISSGGAILLGTALGADTAQGFIRSKAKALGATTETDAAQALIRTKVESIGTAVETSAAVSLTKVKLHALGIAAEIGSVLALARGKAKALGVAAEVDSALAIINGSAIAPTPAERTYVVPAESRAYVVPAEARTYTVPADIRTGVG